MRSVLRLRIGRSGLVSIACVLVVFACGSSDSSGSSGGTTSSGSSSGDPTGTPPTALLGCAPTCPVTTLVADAFKPRSLVVTGDKVFFIADGGGTKLLSGLFSVPAAGGSATRLAEAAADEHCKSIVTDGAFVYWASPRIEKIPVGGGLVEEIATSVQSESRCIATDEQYVYVYGQVIGESEPSGIWRISKAGGKPLRVAPERPTSIVARSGNVIYSTQTEVKKVSHDGGAVATLAGQLEFDSSRRIDADDAYVYDQNDDDELVTRIPIGGGPPELIAAEQKARGITRNGSTLFWSHRPNDAADNRIMMYDLSAPFVAGAGGRPVITTVGAVDIAVDATHVYWASESEGAIRRAAK